MEATKEQNRQITAIEIAVIAFWIVMVVLIRFL